MLNDILWNVKYKGFTFLFTVWKKAFKDNPV